MKQLFLILTFIVFANIGFTQKPILKISENSDYINLKGKIDKYPIEMFLCLYSGGDGVFPRSKMISGYYTYSNIKKPINLIGSFNAKGYNGGVIQLFELNEEYKKTGLFNGEFIDTVGFLGVWSKLGNDKKLDFELESESFNLTDRTRNSYILETKYNGDVYKTDFGQEFKYIPIIDDYFFFNRNEKLYIIASVYYWSNGIGNGGGSCGAGKEIFIYFIEINSDTNSYKEQHFKVNSCTKGIEGTLYIDKNRFLIADIGWMTKSYMNLKESFTGQFNEMILKTNDFRNPQNSIEVKLNNDNLPAGFIKTK